MVASGLKGVKKRLQFVKKSRLIWSRRVQKCVSKTDQTWPKSVRKVLIVVYRSYQKELKNIHKVAENWFKYGGMVTFGSLSFSDHFFLPLLENFKTFLTKSKKKLKL